MAMLTTVPSMNAMHEPRIAAARIQVRLRFDVTSAMFSPPRTDSFYRGRWRDSAGASPPHRAALRAIAVRPERQRILYRGRGEQPAPRRRAERNGGRP